MAGNPTARDILKGLLQGVPSPRPLFLPIVFSHAARVENLPLRAFLGNATKISNTLRQIRPRLHSDGIACYFDPFLEAETLGATVQWETDDRPPSLHWPEQMKRGEFRGAPPAPTGGRVAIAIDVIRRLKAVVRDDSLLMASVTGPMTLAALLLRLDPSHAFGHPGIPSDALELAAAVVSGITSAFVEAGANVLFIREDFLPALSGEEIESWFSQLATTFNIVRFYEALPVLLLTCRNPSAANAETIARQPADCVVCPLLDDAPSYIAGISSLGLARFGIGLPPELFDPGASNAADFDHAVRRVAGLVSDLGPAIITTAGDLPASADMERLNKLWENMRQK
jgi:hypothetical protein